MIIRTKIRSILTAICVGTVLTFSLRAETPAVPPLPRLTIHGEDFVDASGHPVRFWGVNVVALYPDHATADAMAANLASLQVNLVRPHHLLRESKDWAPEMASGSLVTYDKTSTELEPTALDRFDYLNAAYRRNGIYLALSAHWSRHFLPGDVDILPSTDQKDHDDWVAAVTEINGWDWKKTGEINKSLPVIDERAALVTEEFNKKLLAHVNPYTGTSYASDPQVLTYEVLNESSLEYAIICGSRFPDYFQAKLVAKWNAFATAAGITPGDLYKPADAKTKDVRGQFLRQLDEAYFKRMRAVIRGTGCQAAITYSNLWRGDNASEMEAQNADQIEGHQYMDPLIVGGNNDGFVELTKTAIAGKPYFIGELNQAEGATNIERQSSTRTMLPLATSAYGSLQNWSGVVWFAWTHGAQTLGADGWSTSEGRVSSLGIMLNDGMMLDYLRTAGIMFRRELVAKSQAPVTLWVDDPVTVGDYSGLMRGKYNYAPGWQEIHEMRKSYGPVPADQADAPWMKQSPPNPLVSDTGEITKDIERKQLTVAAPQAEAFSGYLDGKPLAGPKHLTLEGNSGFATVILVSDDNQNLGASQHLIISRTGLDAANADSATPVVHLSGLQPAANNLHWYLRLTRPRPTTAVAGAPVETKLEAAADGSIELPRTDWHEAELLLHQ